MHGLNSFPLINKVASFSLGEHKRLWWIYGPFYLFYCGCICIAYAREIGAFCVEGQVAPTCFMVMDLVFILAYILMLYLKFKAKFNIVWDQCDGKHDFWTQKVKETDCAPCSIKKLFRIGSNRLLIHMSIMLILFSS